MERSHHGAEALRSNKVALASGYFRAGLVGVFENTTANGEKEFRLVGVANPQHAARWRKIAQTLPAVRGG